MADGEGIVRVRSRQCAECGKTFIYVIRRGADRRFCNAECVKVAAKRRAPLRPMGLCSVPGCRDDANRAGAGLCEKHYMRQRRKGTVEPFAPKQRYGHSQGYVKVRCLGHPLVQGKRNPIEYEHRVVFYNARGAGPFRCHHCGVEVTWSDMHVDHLNDTPDDNRVDNLVPSCPGCNQKRGRWKMRQKARAQGVQLTAHGRTQCMSEWAREIGISQQSLRWRLANGWTLERALSEPRGVTGPKGRGAPESSRPSAA